MKGIIALAILCLIFIPSVAASTYDVRIVDQERNPIFLNALVSIDFFKDENGTLRVIGETDEVFFVNEEGTMTLFSTKYTIYDIDLAEFTSSTTDIVPVGNKVEAYTHGNVIYVELHTAYKFDKYVEGSSLWARLSTNHIDKMVIDAKEGLDGRLETATNPIRRAFVKTLNLAEYTFSFDLGPIGFLINLFYTPLPIKNPMTFIGPDYINIPNMLGYLLIGIMVSLAAYFSLARLLLDPAHRVKMFTEMFSFTLLAMIVYCGTYFFTAYYFNTASALYLSIGALIIIALGNIFYVRVYAKEMPRSILVIFFKTIAKVLRGIGRGTKKIIKVPIKATTYPVKKVSNHGKEYREEAKTIKQLEKFNMPKEMRYKKEENQEDKPKRLNI